MLLHAEIKKEGTHVSTACQQMVLYLLMCIPATLPAAFLAFNQVFLSATPEHWCRVGALANTNLSLEQIKGASM